MECQGEAPFNTEQMARKVLGRGGLWWETTEFELSWQLLEGCGPSQLSLGLAQTDFLGFPEHKGYRIKASIKEVNYTRAIC